MTQPIPRHAYTLLFFYACNLLKAVREADQVMVEGAVLEAADLFERMVLEVTDFYKPRRQRDLFT